MFQGVLAGVTDIGEVWADVVESMALNKFNTLPFLGLYPEETATIIYRELLNKFPALTEEYQGLKLLYPCCWGGRQWVHTTKKLITSREDMKGVKFIGSGGTAEWLDLMGAVPVNVFFQDWYTSLQKGLVEGTVGNWPPINASGSTLLLKYHTGISVPLTISAAPVIMNPASWNRLPPDIQKIFEDLDSWFVETRINFVARQQNEDIYKRTLEAGDTYVELSPEEMQSWVDVAKPLHEKWIEEMEAKGKPGRALYEELQRLMKEYSKK
jgi:TRAP-type C4-dicarboxylate transport system substrate-binding protein